MKIEINESEEKLKKALNKIFVENCAEKGIYSNFLAFSFSIKDNNGNIVGGVRGWRIFNEIYVDELAVVKNARNQGYGKKLLETVEQKVNDGSCDNINLTTNEFQRSQGSIDFYKKCGFEVEYIRYNGKNIKSNKYYMIKKL